MVDYFSSQMSAAGCHSCSPLVQVYLSAVGAARAGHHSVCNYPLHHLTHCRQQQLTVVPEAHLVAAAAAEIAAAAGFAAAVGLAAAVA